VPGFDNLILVTCLSRKSEIQNPGSNSPTRLLVQAWIEIPRDELLADWRLAVNGEEVFKIDPLK